MPTLRKSFISKLLLAIAVLTTIAVPACTQPTEDELGETHEVIQHLRDDFIDQEMLTEDALNQAAIEGILEYLDDPYTAYLSGEQYQDFTGRLEGNGQEFEGIGAELTIRDGEAMVVGPLPDSPAMRSGLEPGDIVLSVDGDSVEGLDLIEIVNMIRGPEGTTVVLTILGRGDLQPVDVSVERETITVTSVFSRMQAEDIGYIRLDTFDEQTPQGLRDAIDSLTAEGAEGLLLDLRNNAGGLVNSAVSVVSEFVPEGLVCQGCQFGTEDNTRSVTGEGTAFEIPLVVLVNGFSASASEIVAGALQDHDRATIVGSTTFGKGSVNVLQGLDTGAGLYLTVARWETPDGRQIEGQGIEPDVEVSAAANAQALQRVGSLTVSLCEAYEEERQELNSRPELNQALEDLCTVSETPAPPPTSDETLDVAVEELRMLMGG